MPFYVYMHLSRLSRSYQYHSCCRSRQPARCPRCPTVCPCGSWRRRRPRHGSSRASRPLRRQARQSMPLFSTPCSCCSVARAISIAIGSDYAIERSRHGRFGVWSRRLVSRECATSDSSSDAATSSSSSTLPSPCRCRRVAATTALSANASDRRVDAFDSTNANAIDVAAACAICVCCNRYSCYLDRFVHDPSATNKQ